MLCLLPMRRLSLQIRLIQNCVRPVSTDAWHLGGCREVHKGGKSTLLEDEQTAIAGREKKRRRRTANARLRAWTANEDLISYIDDFERGQTPRARPISAEEAWRRSMGKLSARRSSRKANRGEMILGTICLLHVRTVQMHTTVAEQSSFPRLGKVSSAIKS